MGSDVTGFEPGDDVFGICARSFAEYVGVGIDKLAPKPSNLSFKEAAAVPISGLTALRPCATTEEPRRTPPTWSRCAS